MNDAKNTAHMIIVIGFVVCFTGIGIIVGIPMICWGFNILRASA